MADTLQPGDAKDVEAAVQWMLAEGKAAEIVGHGSKRAIGRPAQTDVTLDLSALSGVMLYEPEELVLSAKAGDAAGRDRSPGGEPGPATRVRAHGLRDHSRRGRRPRDDRGRPGGKSLGPAPHQGRCRA